MTTYLPGRPDCVSQKVLHPEIRMQIPLEEKILPRYFKPAGYVCGAVGKWHVGGKGFGPLDHGFDFYHQGRANTTPSATEGGKGEYDLATAVEQFITVNREKPFLVYLAHNTPHIPYAAQQDRIDKNSGAFEPVYAGVIETLDDTIGRLMAKLDELKLAEKTILIFTSDNGGLHVPEGPHPKITHNTPYRAGKGYVYEGGLRIPLIVRWPGHIPAGMVVDEPVMNTDWLPTLLELAGQPVPQGLDGISFAAGLKGGEMPKRRLFWHFPHYNNQGGRPSGAVRDGDWLMIEYYDEDKVELYNLRSDISEKHDVSPQHSELAAQLKKALAKWRIDNKAQSNTPNPDFIPGKFHELYVDVNPGKFDAATAGDAQWKQIQLWREGMNSVLRRKK